MMTMLEIAEHCDVVLNAKANEYSSPADRWHNFIAASNVGGVFPSNFKSLRPEDWVCAFAMKHYVSCLDIQRGHKDFSEALVKEKAGDLLNYYLIYRAIRSDVPYVRPEEWLEDLQDNPERPWSLGLELLLDEWNES